MVSQDEEARGNSKDEGFEVLESIISGSPDISRSEEAENVFGGLRQLPKLLQ